MDCKQMPLNVPNFYKTDFHLKMYNFENIPELKYSLEQQSPIFLHQGPVFWKTILPWTMGGVMVLG